MNEAIVFDHVDFEYDPNEPVIRDLSLKICEGEFVAVLGHNGSGKSTLAKLINAILVPPAAR
jgi:energy-coupling factor transport system ATP-binding protein